MFPNLRNSIILYLSYCNHLSLEIIFCFMTDLYKFVIT